MRFPLRRGILAGLGAKRLRNALGNVNLALQTAPCGLGRAHQQTSGRSWRDVPASIPAPQWAPMTWDPGRTPILYPTDAKRTTMTISTYNFGEALWGLFPMGSKNDEQFRLENVMCLSIGAFKI